MTSSRISESPDGLIVGRIVGAFGVRGEAKLLPLTDFPERLRRHKTLHFRLADGSEEALAVQGWRPHKGLLLVRLAGIATPEAVGRLRDAEVWVPVSEAAPLPRGEYYIHEVVGLRVVTEEGEELGRVDEVIRTPSNDVYRVGQLLIPATHDAVLELDPPGDRIVTRSRAYLEGQDG